MRKSPLACINQIAIVVKNIDEAVDYFSSLGMGPFRKGPSGVSPITERTKRGKSIQFKTELRFAQAGNIELELIQPLEDDDSIYMEFLKNHGPGVHHFGFFVDDIDNAELELSGRGLKVLARGRRPTGGGGTTHFEPDPICGLVIELVQRPRDFWKNI